MLYTEEAIIKRKEKNSRRKKIVVTIIYIILVPLLLYNITLIFKSLINPNKTPDFFGYKTYVIISGSMEPNLKIGDIVIVKKVDEDQLNVGDIISFRQGQNVVTHRISQIKNEYGEKVYVTKGDHNNAEDAGTIDYSYIEGKVVNSIKKMGKLVIFFQGKLSILVIVIVFYMYLSQTNKINKRKEDRKSKREKYEKQN